MRSTINSGSRRRKVAFPWITIAPASRSYAEKQGNRRPAAASTVSSRSTDISTTSSPKPQNRVNMSDSQKSEPVAGVPSLYTDLAPIRDLLTTETSNVQDATVQQCLPFLAGTADPGKLPFDFNGYGVPRLDRENHIAFLHDSLGEFPAGFVGLDASRPWMLYWALTGLSLLGEDVSPYREG